MPNQAGQSGGGGGLLSGLLGRAARSVFDSAMNSTTNANYGTGREAPSSRTFLDLYAGSENVDGGANTVVEYSGKTANNEIATIYPISLRAGDLILHGPKKSEIPSSPTYTLFNIILHAANASSTSEKMFSLYRTDSEAEASRVFVIYKQVIPDLVKASPSPMDRATLEKILKLVKQNESYLAPHVAAALNMTEQLRSPVLRDMLIDREEKLRHTPLHVATVHGKLDAIKAIAEDERQFNRVFDLEDDNGNTVVHLAAASKDKSVGTSILKFLKQRIWQQTGTQRVSSSRVLFGLFQKLNREGYAPIHLACLNSNKEAVELMVGMVDSLVVESHEIEVVDLEAEEELSTAEVDPPSDAFVEAPTGSSELLDIRDASSGSTPLLLVTGDPPMLTHLLAAGCDPNVTDNDGLTPLHKAVLLQNLKSVLQLLSNNAFTDFSATFERYKDATPLHVAATICDIDCMKALIVFGADMELKDRNGHTARHIVASVFTGNKSVKEEALFVLAAAGAQRCGAGSSGCADGCKLRGTTNGKKPNSWRILRDGTGGNIPDTGHLLHEAMRGLSIIRESFDNGMDTDSSQSDGPVVGGRLLALDGGGIRGLVLTQMLLFMEKEFGNIAGGGAPIISYFDWVAGTSTGGILALALACGKSVLETQSLYIKLKDKVFTGSRPYSAARMEEFLKKEFGQDRKMSSIQKPRVMVMTALANRRPPDLYVFRNYISPSHLLGEPEEHSQLPDETFVWETAKVTGAAPSYFTLDHELFVDGGLISNNPTMDALSELVQFKSVMMGGQHPGRNGWKLPSVVLSLGTGIPPKQESAATMLDVQWPTGVFDAIKNVPKIRDLIHLLVDQATQAEGQVVERARAWCSSIGVPYFRFSPEMGADIDLDEKQDNVLVNLMWETWCYMVGHRNEIREIFQRLQEADVNLRDTTNNDARPSLMEM